MDLYRLSLRAIPYKRSILIGGFLLGFAITAAALAFSGLLITKSRLASHAADQMHLLNQTTSKWLGTFQRFAELGEMDACSPDFIAHMRQLAFLPDGIHELLYLRGDSIICSVTIGLAEQPIRIGAPDLTLEGNGVEAWIDRDLDLLDLPNLSGTYLRIGNFMVIVSEPALPAPPASWMNQRLSYLTTGGKFAVAEQGPLAYEAAYEDVGGPWDLKRSACEASGIFCVDLEAPLGEIIEHEQLPVLAGIFASVLSGLLAACLMNRWLSRLWAFSNRIRYLMDRDSVTCDYQPILSFTEGRIGGIEVLARWRDDSGAIVYPDKFLPVVQNLGLTRSFTEILVQRVCGDLQGLPHSGAPIRVHFNIFPQDFDADWLLATFAPLLVLSDRFVVVAELVESDCMPLEETRETVEALRKRGILTYIDDFGAGFSNIQYLGHLDVAGVKLDRAFGQAPEGSLMAGLLSSAAEMIKGAGFPLVVEGIETEERLLSLRQCGLIEQAQGYHIARPLKFDDLVTFLQTYRLHPPVVQTRPLSIAI